MTGADAYLLQVQAAARERNRPFDVDQLTPEQRVTISTARLMNAAPGDCELLLNGQVMPHRPVST